MINTYGYGGFKIRILKDGKQLRIPVPGITAL